MDRETALRELPHPYAVALRLQDRGAAHDEIAAVVGIDRSAVPSHLELAEAKLARVLGADAEAET